MTWSYSGDPASSDRDAVRFLVGDVDTTVQLLTDEEIDFLLATQMPLRGSTTWVAAEAAAVLSTRSAPDVNVSGDGVDVSIGDLQARWTAVAAELRARYQAEQAFSGVLPDVDDTRHKQFAVGMGDNAWAGSQDQEPWIPDGTIGPTYTP